jgi:type I restriction-modification system DNA methylase subunit
MKKLKNFLSDWTGRGYEKGEMQTFWLTFLRDVLEVTEPEKIIKFEEPIPNGFIDALIEDTRVLIEQKSSTVKLDETVFLQAKKYNDTLEYSRKARWIVTCNFKEFQIYDMNKRKPELEPLKILLAELPKKFRLFEFLIDRNKLKLRTEEEISVAAGKVVDKLYETLKKNYLNPANESSLKSLNKLCVRLVFCLYAESAGILGKHKIFTEYLEKASDIRHSLISLFKVLNTPENLRDPYDDELNKFPYINGGLFADSEIEIPRITAATRSILVNEICNFKWADISPTIFGAVFESTINAKVRRAGGMHYTSPTNIHKIIDSLFLDDLRAEFHTLKGKKKLLEFQDKLANLKIFDPACGSGNFLTESFISLRRLENEVLRELTGNQILMGEFVNPVKVSIQQFYGIEIDDFAVAVAKTALWISELQMLKETAKIIHKPLEVFPLKSYSNIHEGNALQMNWEEIISPDECNYIISNPPFVGKSFQTQMQKSDMAKVFVGVKSYGNLDYVASWYKKAVDFLQMTKVRCAFVSTNSICQGIAVPPLWKYIFEKKCHIDFAHRTFKWNSESEDAANVHVVIISFSQVEGLPKFIFDGEKKIVTKNINAYLLNAPNVIVEPRSKPFGKVPPMIVGSCPTDGGNLIIEAADYEKFVLREPSAKKYIRPYLGSEEFINGKERYCLWLKDCPPNEIRKMPLVMKRVQAVKEFRLKSKKEQTRHRAETPTLFAEDRFVDAPAIFIPMVSSENRPYIPFGFISAGVVANNKSLVIPNGDLYLFGVLTSSVHMAWVKVVAGRLEMRYSYGVQTVYNTFPFCEVTDKQKRAIESTAQEILDVRHSYPDSTLADLYDELTMPRDLRDAHKANDTAVMTAYGFRADLTETEIVTSLMNRYLQMIEKEKIT